MNKITEKTAAESLKDAAYFLVTQQETVDGSDVEALRRAKRDLVEKALVEPKYLGLYNAIYGTNGGFAQLRSLMISQTNTWGLPGGSHVCLPCKAGDKIVITANANQKAYYAFLASDTVIQNATPDYAGDESGRHELTQGYVSEELTAPEGCNWLYLHHTYTDGTTSFYPHSIKINGIEQTWSAAKANEQMGTAMQQITKAAQLTTGMVEWEKGALGTVSGAEAKTEQRIRSKWYYLIDPEGEITFTGDAGTDRQIRAMYFDERFSFVSSVDITAVGQFAIPSGACFVRFVYGFKNASSETVDSYGGVDAVAADWSISYVSPAEKENRQLAEFKRAMTVLNAVDYTWQSGSISTSLGTNTTNTARIRTPLHNFKNGIKVALPEGMEMSTRIYSAEGVYEGWQDWASGTFEIPLTEEKGYRFVVRYTDESTIDTSAGAEVAISEVKYADMSLHTDGKAADAKATGDMFAALGIVPYWANGYKSNSGGQILQENSLITLNGYNSGTSYRVMLSGTLDIGILNKVFTEAPDTILLKAGHTYKMKIEHVGGSYVEDVDGRFEVSFGIYQGEVFEPVTPRAALVEGVDIDWKTFTPSVTGLYKIGMMVYRKVTYTDYQVRAVLTDITEWVSA